MDIHWDTSRSVPSGKNSLGYCWDDCTSVFLTYLCDWNPWFCVVWNFWLLQRSSWDKVASGLQCHVTEWLVLKVSRPLRSPWNVRHQSHSDMAPYARRTKTSTLRYFLEGLKHVDISCEWSDLGGGWSNMQYNRLFFLHFGLNWQLIDFVWWIMFLELPVFNHTTLCLLYHVHCVAQLVFAGVSWIQPCDPLGICYIH